MRGPRANRSVWGAALFLVCLIAIPASAAERKQAPRETAARATWYGGDYHGKRTASGAVFDARGFTAAHPTIPFGTKLKVTNQRNGRATTVTVNDRCRCSIDLSEAAAREIGIHSAGTAPVRLARVN